MNGSFLREFAANPIGTELLMRAIVSLLPVDQRSIVPLASC
jgi:hypothetical protein